MIFSSRHKSWLKYLKLQKKIKTLIKCLLNKNYAFNLVRYEKNFLLKVIKHCNIKTALKFTKTN